MISESLLLCITNIILLSPSSTSQITAIYSATLKLDFKIAVIAVICPVKYFQFFIVLQKTFLSRYLR